MAHEKIKQALAENTAHMRMIGDQYTKIIAGADREISIEKAKRYPSPWKIKSLEHLREKAENNIARFKAGPARTPDWLWHKE